MVQKPNLNELAKRVADINERNGWTIDLSNRMEIGIKVALVASEACEVLDERDKWTGDGESGPIFDAMAVEYADAAIRVLHMLLGLGIDAEAAYASSTWKPSRFDQTLAGELMQELVRPSFRIFEVLREPKPLAELKGRLAPEFGSLLRACEAGSEILGRPMWPVIEAKLAKNATRGFKHGGKAF